MSAAAATTSPASQTAEAAPAEKRRVVFVDDEQLVLNGLENITRRQRKQWDMRFVVGGPAALELLDKEPVDLLVTDMRMPGMDGAQLLEEVRAKHPQVARIILSGQADGDSVWRAIRVAQQFLSKPCEIDRLRAVITNTLDAQRYVMDAKVRAMVGKLDSLRLLPQTRPQLCELLSGAKVDAGAVASLIERDPGMFIKVLQLVSTAFFGNAPGIVSTRKAVEYLGFETLRTLIEGKEFEFNMHGQVEGPLGAALLSYQRRALLSARVARRLAPPDAQDHAFAAALLAESGKMAMSSSDLGRFQEIFRRRLQGEATADLELEVFGAKNAELGAYLMTVWGLPSELCRLVAGQTARAGEAEPDPTLYAVRAGLTLAGPILTAPHLLGSPAAQAEVLAPYRQHQHLVAEELAAGGLP